MPTIDQFRKSQTDGAQAFAALVEKRVTDTGEDERTARLAVLKTAEGRQAYNASGGYSAPDPSVKKAVQTSTPAPADPSSAQGQLEALAKRYQAAHSCDDRTARLAVLKTAEGRALYCDAEQDKRDAALASRARR